MSMLECGGGQRKTGRRGGQSRIGREQDQEGGGLDRVELRKADWWGIVSRGVTVSRERVVMH